MQSHNKYFPKTTISVRLKGADFVPLSFITVNISYNRTICSRDSEQGLPGGQGVTPPRSLMDYLVLRKINKLLTLYPSHYKHSVRRKHLTLHPQR